MHFHGGIHRVNGSIRKIMLMVIYIEAPQDVTHIACERRVSNFCDANHVGN